MSRTAERRPAGNETAPVTTGQEVTGSVTPTTGEHTACAELGGRLLAQAYRDGLADGLAAAARQRAQDVEDELQQLRTTGAALAQAPTRLERVAQLCTGDTPVQTAALERAHAQHTRVWAGWIGTAAAS